MLAFNTLQKILFDITELYNIYCVLSEQVEGAGTIKSSIINDMPAQKGIMSDATQKQAFKIIESRGFLRKTEIKLNLIKYRLNVFLQFDTSLTEAEKILISSYYLNFVPDSEMKIINGNRWSQKLNSLLKRIEKNK